MEHDSNDHSRSSSSSSVTRQDEALSLESSPAASLGNVMLDSRDQYTHTHRPQTGSVEHEHVSGTLVVPPPLPLHKASLDILLTYAVGMVVALWWRSVWELMDKYFVVDGTDDPVTLPNIMFSLFIGLVSMTACVAARGPLIRREKSSPNALWSDVKERLFTLVMGLAAIAQWRGAWYLGDLYFADDTQAVTINTVVNVITTVVLLATFSFKSVLSGVFLDGSGYDCYTFHEAWTEEGNGGLERIKRVCKHAIRRCMSANVPPSATSTANPHVELEESVTHSEGEAGHESSAPQEARSSLIRTTNNGDGSETELQPLQ